jgi:hypothetical protein
LDFLPFASQRRELSPYAFPEASSDQSRLQSTFLEMSVGIVASDCDCSDKPKNGGVSVPGKSREMVKVYLCRHHAVRCIGSFCVALLRQVTIQLIISIIVSSFGARVAGNKWLKERRSTFRVSQTAPWHSTCGDFHLLPQVSSPRNLAANVI